MKNKKESKNNKMKFILDMYKYGQNNNRLSQNILKKKAVEFYHYGAKAYRV